MSSEYTMTGSDLRTARYAAGLSQEQLAARWGVRQATISSWERSAQLPGYIADAIVGLTRTVDRPA